MLSWRVDFTTGVLGVVAADIEGSDAGELEGEVARGANYVRLWHMGLQSIANTEVKVLDVGRGQGRTG